MADSATKLLIHFDGADEATAYTAETGQTVTFSGGSKIDSAQKKFGATSLYAGDGAGGEYTSVPWESAFDFGSGDFTVDMWVRFTAMNFYHSLFSGRQNDGSDGKWMGMMVQESKIHYMASSTGSSWDLLNGGTDQGSHTLVADTWYHIAMVRSGNVWYGFVNGELDFSKTAAGTMIAANNSVTIGNWTNYGAPTGGWIDEFRISNIARWTSPFVPPTRPYGEIKYINGMAVDLRPAKRIAVAGNAQIDTAQSKFSGSSGYFTAGTDSVGITGDSDFSFGTGAFTVEGFMRIGTFVSDYNNVLGNREANNNTANSFCLAARFSVADPRPYLYGLGLGFTYLGANFSVDTWYHIAIVGNGGADGARTVKVYINGTLQGTATANYNINQSRLMIGNDVGGANPTHWWDEVRVSKGVQRWTSDFTPPIKPYNNDVNTHLLLHFDGADASTNIVDNNVDVKSINGLALESVKSFNGLR